MFHIAEKFEVRPPGEAKLHWSDNFFWSYRFFLSTIIYSSNEKLPQDTAFRKACTHPTFLSDYIALDIIKVNHYDYIREKEVW